MSALVRRLQTPEPSSVCYPFLTLFSSSFAGDLASSDMSSSISVDEDSEQPFGTDLYFILELEAANPPLQQQPRVLSVLTSILERVVRKNDDCTFPSLPLGVPSASGIASITIFHGLRPPSISVGKYLERICKYINCSPSCFVAAYIYIDRLIQRHPTLIISSLNVHRLLITSIMVAAKFLDDS